MEAAPHLQGAIEDAGRKMKQIQNGTKMRTKTSTRGDLGENPADVLGCTKGR